jgi:hypothetical protein
MTRYAAAAGTTWWVTYTVILNPCATAGRLTGLAVVHQQPGSGAAWTGSSRVRVLAAGDIPNAVLPGAGAEAPGVGGFTVKPSERVEVAALVRAGGADDVSHRVPVLELGLRDDAGADRLALAPDLRLCACNPLS